jgi:Competence protein
VGEYVLLTFAAQITTLPVIAYHFNRISLVAFLVNPLILPAQLPVMIVGGLALLVSLVFQPLGQLLAYLAWPFVVFTIRVVEFFAPIPGAMLQLGQVALPLILIYYALLFAWTFARPSLRSRFSSLKADCIRPGVALLGLGLVVVLVWRSALATPDGRLHLEMLDVGSGDAFLIHTPAGRYVLVDGGPSARALSDALGRRLPPAICKLPGARPPSPYILPRPVKSWIWGRALACKCWGPTAAGPSFCWNGAISAPCCQSAWTKTCASPCWKTPVPCRSMPCCWPAAARLASARPNGCRPGIRSWRCSAWRRGIAAPVPPRRRCRPYKVIPCCAPTKTGGCISAPMAKIYGRKSKYLKWPSIAISP